jgi:hypothetical protein
MPSRDASAAARVRLIKLGEGDKLVAVARIDADDLAACLAAPLEEK